MSDAIRRAHSRYPCHRTAEVFQGTITGHRLGEAFMLDISLAGSFVRFDAELRPGTSYRLRMEGPAGSFEIPCRVVRIGPRGAPGEPAARYYGLAFNLTVDQENSLRRLVDQVRREPPVTETPFERSLRNYW